jgi:hypothetical protein
MSQPDNWIPLPDSVACLLGRVVYYSTWLDDLLGEAVVLADPNSDETAEATPNWAASGDRLVSAVRAMPVEGSLPDDLADHLAALNVTRNLLVHGVWLWQDDHVLVMKRALRKGERHVEYDTLTYRQIEKVVARYQRVGGLVDRLIEILRRRGRTGEDRLPCPEDGTPLEAAMVADEIFQRCPACGLTISAAPTD